MLNHFIILKLPKESHKNCWKSKPKIKIFFLNSLFKKIQMNRFFRSNKIFSIVGSYLLLITYYLLFYLGHNWFMIRWQNNTIDCISHRISIFSLFHTTKFFSIISNESFLHKIYNWYSHLNTYYIVCTKFTPSRIKKTVIFTKNVSYKKCLFFL